jgi:hypothetical protein
LLQLAGLHCCKLLLNLLLGCICWLQGGAAVGPPPPPPHVLLLQLIVASCWPALL